GLEDDVVVRGKAKDGVALIPVSARGPPMRYAQFPEVRGDLGHIVFPVRGERDTARADIDRLARIGFLLIPVAIRLRHQSGVSGVGVRVSSDPRRPVRAAPGVAQIKLLDQNHWLAPPGEVIGRGRAHGAGADDYILDGESFHGSNESSKASG